MYIDFYKFIELVGSSKHSRITWTELLPESRLILTWRRRFETV